jgi:hypothetical protein
MSCIINKNWRVDKILSEKNCQRVYKMFKTERLSFKVFWSAIFLIVLEDLTYL